MPERKPPSTPVRSFWSGTITFGLVSIPVDLLAAARPRRKSMKLVDDEGHPLGRRYYCPKDDKILDSKDLVRGYETESGKMVVITDEEFESAAPEKSRDIELKRFVPVEAIPPSFFERPYFLAPDERAGKAYSLLAQTMASTGKAGIGSFVMRSHEYLLAILSENGMLRAEVLRYANEVRTAATIGLPKPGKGEARQVRELAKEIDSLSEDRLDLSEMEDIEAGALLKLAQRKAKSGKGVIAMEALEDLDDDAAAGAEVIDLMEVLRKSLGARAAPAKAGAGSEKAGSAPARAAKPARPPSANGAGAKRGATTRKTSGATTPTGKRAAKRVQTKGVASGKAKAATKPAAKRSASTRSATAKKAA